MKKVMRLRLQGNAGSRLGRELVEAGIAQKIVAKFGVETLEIIQHYPDRLEEVFGIGPKLIEAIREGIPG
jgi:hypothetical protein